MTTNKPKKNPDYSASAVNLTNSPDVQRELEHYLYWKAQSEICQADIDDFLVKSAPGLVAAKSHSDETVKAYREKLEEAIREKGSYQDVDNGHYALLQAKFSKEWHADAFWSIKATPAMKKAADMVIVQVVNPEAVEGLIKGKLLTEKELLASGALTFKELAPALIIK